VPLFGRPKEPTPASDAGTNLEPALPLPDGDLQIRVDEVLIVAGRGMIVLGTVTRGVVRPPMDLVVQPGPGSSSLARTVSVVEAVAHHQSLPEVGVGANAAFTIRGERLGGHASRSLIRRGDLLVPR
jgi:translation elongation factor EF-Tu-like GTPase